MKAFILVLVVLAALQSHAISWKVFGACDEKPIFQGQYTADVGKSLGLISQEIFDLNKIPYIGAPEGYNSINNTPVGLDSIEIVSDTEMRVYGWCYSLNGKVPEDMPHKVNIQSQDDRLIWFYAYSTHRDGEWQDYCSPAYWIKADQFCK